MMRTVLGGIVGGFALYLVGFLFWGSPLSNLAFSTVDDARGAAVQTALAQNLTENGTGTYVIPWPSTQQGTVLFGQGPIATVHFNTGGFPVVDTSSLIAGLVLALITGLIIAFALKIVGDRVPGFPERAKVAVLFALAATLYLDIGQPIFNHYGSRYFIYLFLSDFIGLAVAGLVIAKWFLPREAIAAAESPSLH
jgi:hypothetical protein